MFVCSVCAQPMCEHACEHVALPCMVCHLDGTESAWNSPIVLCWSLISIVKISNCVRHEARTQSLPPAVSCQFLLSVRHTHTHTHAHAKCSFRWHADERRPRLLAACHQSATHEHQSDVIGLTDRALFITLTVNPAVYSDMLGRCLQKVVFLPPPFFFFFAWHIRRLPRFLPCVPSSPF